MIGIVSYGAYIPLYRIGKGTNGWSSALGKAVANFDEDSITMGTAAAINCLQYIPPHSVDALYFASTTPPYAEKSNAAVVATASDLPANICTMDFSHSLRAGTNALKAAIDAVSSGSIKQALIVAADMRIAQPRSDFETTLGDGAASLLIGNDNVIAEYVDCYSTSHEIQDIWRAEGDKFIRSWEERFIAEEGYLKIMPEAVKGLMAKHNLKPSDFARVVLYGPDSRRHQQLASLLGFEPKSQVQDPLLSSIGNTGAAATLLTLTAALEETKPGDKILVASYGNGADVIIFKVTEHISGLQKTRRGVTSYLDSKKLLPDYEMYLTWRGLFDKAPPQRRPQPRMPSPAAMLREIDKNLRFHGSKCKSCGYPQYPPQRICTRCHSKDHFAEYKFADKPATVFTYTMDYLAPTADPPMVVAVINFEGGGRAFCVMTDRDTKGVEIGMSVEMTFRRLTTIEGIHNYYWKCMPPR